MVVVLAEAEAMTELEEEDWVEEEDAEVPNTNFW